MADYLWSARFVCGCLALLLGVALLVGSLLDRRFGDPENLYFVLLGAALCLDGIVLAARGRAGLALFGAVMLAAIAWTVLAVGLDIWRLLPRLLAPGLWAAILFTLRHRIARRRPHGIPLERIRDAWRQGLQSIRRHCVELPYGEDRP